MSYSGMSSFFNHLPVRIRFGDGVAGALGDVLAEAGARRALVVLDRGLEEASPAVAAAVASATTRGVVVGHHLKEPGEPTVDEVDAAAAAVTAMGADAVVAIGGGSVIDTAKTARLCAQLGCAFRDVVESGAPYPKPAAALIALPTTAGTGSEVSGGAVVTDPLADTKAGIAGATLRAQHALVDPLLTYSVPPAMTAYTGVDALAQAVAGMVARTRTPIGDAIALEAVRLIGRSLVRAYRDGGDAAARSEMACASLMAGLTMNVSDCAAEHSLAQALGRRFDAPHGLTVGLVLAETLDRERQHVPEQLERVASALGASDDGSGDGSRAVRAVRELLARLDFPVLRELGANGGDVDALAARAMQDFFITQSPVPWVLAEVRAAFTAALDETDRAAPAPTVL